MKKCNCPKCDMELINLTPTYRNKAYFACLKCDIDICIIHNSKEKENENETQ